MPGHAGVLLRSLERESVPTALSRGRGKCGGYLMLSRTLAPPLPHRRLTVPTSIRNLSAARATQPSTLCSGIPVHSLAAWIAVSRNASRNDFVGGPPFPWRITSFNSTPSRSDSSGDISRDRIRPNASRIRGSRGVATRKNARTSFAASADKPKYHSRMRSESMLLKASWNRPIRQSARSSFVLHRHSVQANATDGSGFGSNRFRAADRAEK